ncbi:MAG: hypothetical protein IKX48_13495 [Victivallales bacterium]|nr:hypothetical protein [Victivallales bacterium]
MAKPDIFSKKITFSNLYRYLRLYRVFPILDTLCPKLGNLLSWSHYRALLQVNDSTVRKWYLNEAYGRRQSDVGDYSLCGYGFGYSQVLHPAWQ